jgi:hypothetical protein
MVKAKGAEAAAAGRMRQVDFSDFYKRFGFGVRDDDAGDAPGGGGGGDGNSSGSGGGGGGGGSGG